MSVWFTADTHFGHPAILDYCERPFSCVEEHDAGLIDNWNKCVAPGDVVYHVGDFAFGNQAAPIEKLVRRLNGSVHLIYGNHDEKAVRRAGGFAWKGDLKYIKVNGQKIMLCHYAMRVWRAHYKGSWMLYGHSHGTLEPKEFGRSLDVGVDEWGYCPVGFDTLALCMHERTPSIVDYHGTTEYTKRLAEKEK